MTVSYKFLNVFLREDFSFLLIFLKEVMLVEGKIWQKID